MQVEGDSFQRDGPPTEDSTAACPDTKEDGDGDSDRTERRAPCGGYTSALGTPVLGYFEAVGLGAPAPCRYDGVARDNSGTPIEVSGSERWLERALTGTSTQGVNMCGPLTASKIWSMAHPEFRIKHGDLEYTDIELRDRLILTMYFSSDAYMAARASRQWH